AFSATDAVDTLVMEPKGKSALHLYMILLNPEVMGGDRANMLAEAREMGVELSVNYTPIHLFSWYRKFCATPGAYPNAEYCGANVISLPFYPAMTNRDVQHVIEVMQHLLKKYRR
ncbi:MAG: DegT/DnrJ/EryC1/StrS family aminotransferase, partial [Bacteroidota bacterium]